jgi:alkylation response protein AidB-like acyl-CoA dehydrogenase
MYVESLQRLLTDLLPEAVVREIESGESASHAWRRIEQAGFLDLLLPEDAQGPGLELPQACALFRLLGRHVIPLPLAASWIARRILARHTHPDGPLAVATGRVDEDGRITCPRVPFGAVADHVLVVAEDRLLLVSMASALTTSRLGDARGLALRCVWGEDAVAWRQEHGGKALQAWMAASTAAQIAGALDAVLDMCLAHCNQRRQFGKSIAQFQAVQHQLSVMAEHVLAASMAAELAFGGADSGPAWLASAIAKARTSEASALVCACAHALHGAIGMTEEYALGVYTRRLQEWRMDHGTEGHWHAAIGAQVLGDPRSVADVVTGL